MTKEITKAIILQELQDKFRLREFEPSKFLFSEIVVPTYDLSDHLSHWELMSQTVSITSATYFTFFTVPEDEQWTLRAYQVVYGMTGAIKGTGLHLARKVSNIYLDLKKGQEVSYLVNLPVPVVLEHGDILRYMIDTYVSTQDLIIRIDVRKEEIR